MNSFILQPVRPVEKAVNQLYVIILGTSRGAMLRIALFSFDNVLEAQTRTSIAISVPLLLFTRRIKVCTARDLNNFCGTTATAVSSVRFIESYLIRRGREHISEFPTNTEYQFAMKFSHLHIVSL